MDMARVVAEMYRVENVIHVRIKAIADQRALTSPTAQLLSYRPKTRLPVRLESDDLGLEPTSPLGPVQG
jgi:hypothetical protein